jgi:epoxyqueuosine reductase QueG
MTLNGKIQKIIDNNYGNLFGVADVKEYENELVSYGGEIVKGYNFGISIGIVLPGSIVDGLKNRFDKNISSLYYTHSYHIINERLNIISSIISSFLNNQGYKTLPIPAAERTDIDNAIPTISHRMIAHLSGLGWIGKSCLLVTPDFGPRVRLVSVLTNAPLKVTGSIVEQKCNSCVECVEICPVQAITGKNFNIGDARSVRFDFMKCQDYFDEMKKDESRKPVCGMCLYICPYGKKK